tara:strand:+ start:3782 stop:4891 length:1110 start_codon:yes stop_codon:yes gene_type:complete
MEFSIWSFVLENLDASGGIGGYVSISIIGFALISFTAKKKLKNGLKPLKFKWTHSAIGSLMGAIPGCGATIVVASLYKSKKISFGGLFAAFISTLGEGSFVLLGASSEAADISGNIKAYITITLIGLIVGFIFGFISDILGTNPNNENLQKDNLSNNIPLKKKKNRLGILFEKISFYIILLISIILAPGSIMALWGGEIDVISNLTYWYSIILSITCIAYYFMTKFIFLENDCSCNEDNLKSIIKHAIKDVSLVVTYVFIGLIVANFVIDEIVGSEIFDSWMSSSAYIVVLLAALIGAIPGCGGMITVAVAYITISNFPLAALIAAGIATSGDGIFPLLAENKKDGLIISIAGLFIALIVGYLALLFNF